MIIPVKGIAINNFILIEASDSRKNKQAKRNNMPKNFRINFLKGTIFKIDVCRENFLNQLLIEKRENFDRTIGFTY